MFPTKNKENKQENIIDKFVQKLKNKSKLIYFDEFQVTNIVDAMILGSLFKKIFDERPREKNVSIENFLKEIANHPETMGEKLTETERQATDKENSLEELKETLEDANSGKTPGTDGVDKEFLLCPEDLY